MLNSKKSHLIICSTAIIVILLAFFSLGCGRIYLSPMQIIESLVHPAQHPVNSNIIFALRLPRIIGSILIGASLAASGCAFQNVFQNPLVSPDILGVSYGSAVGASVAILAGLGIWGTQFFALIGGIAAVLLTILIARIINHQGTLILVLSGIIVAGFMQAILGLLKYVADPDSQLESIVYWQLGSIAKVDFKSILAVLPMLAVGGIILILLRWHLTIMSLGDQLAASEGINVERERMFAILASTLLTAASTCLSGNIGWVGLVIPHMARSLIGENSRYSLPLSAIVGAGFLLVVDTLARSLSAGEIPLSILTGFIGAPMFVYILLRKKVKLN